MWSRFTSHLYVRIWLAVVATVMVLTFLVGAAWRFTKDPPQLPIREVLVHNQAGEVIGTAQTKQGRKPGDGLEFDVVTNDGQTLKLLLPRPNRPPPPSWSRLPFGFGWTNAQSATNKATEKRRSFFPVVASPAQMSGTFPSIMARTL